MAKRDYENNYPSVTTILGVLRKIGLEMWFKYNTAKFCDEKSAKGKLIGTQIHQAIEEYIKTGKASINTEYDEEVTNALKSFMLFKKENPDTKLTLTEVKLTSQLYEYNGTIDAPTPPVLWDWKTGECKNEDKPKIYDEYKYQAAAYVKLWNENNESNQIDSAYIIALAKDKIAYNLYKMDAHEIDSHFMGAFIPCLTIYNHQKRKDFTDGHESRKEANPQTVTTEGMAQV